MRLIRAAVVLGLTCGVTACSVPSTSIKSTPAKATSAVPVKATVVLRQSGDGMKTTPSFTTGPDWSLAWEFNCTNFGFKGNFIVMEDGMAGSELVNALNVMDSDKTYQHNDSGKHSLQINSECRWTITVTDGDAG